MPAQDNQPAHTPRKKETKLAHFLKILGPGIITGAADDDPSGIATYSQTGAQFGYGILWTALYQIPLLLAVQEACARIGVVTGKGLARVIKDHYSRNILVGVVILVVIANTINIGADIGAVAASTQLIASWAPFWILAIVTAILVVGLEVLVSYKQYANILKWFAIALLSYPVTALIIAEPWKQILIATVVPHIELSFAFLFILTGVFGTSISPYIFFWQASEEVEQEKMLGIKKKGGMPRIPRRYMHDVRVDTTIGMVVAEVAQWFIIITTATVLFAHGVTNINTAADAAKALEPLVQSFPNAGLIAKWIFAIGVIGLGLLGIPVLAGSAAYAMAEAFGWKEGLSKKFKQARAFYGVIIASTLVGLTINFIGINPIKALVFTAVFNGITAVPLLYLIAKINANKDILGDKKGGWLSQTFVWLTFGVMGLSAVALLYTLVMPH